MTRLNTKVIAALALAALSAAGITACTQDAQAMDAQQIEKQYGVSGAYVETINTSDGPLKGMLVPITLANGHQGHLFIPQRQATDLQTVYLRDEEGLHPVRLGANVTRADVVRAPGIVETRAETAAMPTPAPSSIGRPNTRASTAPSVAPTKKSGVTSPPRKPADSVTAVNTIFHHQLIACAPPG